MLGGIEGFFQKIPVLYESQKPNITTGIDKIHLKAETNNGSIVKGVREPILYCLFLVHLQVIQNTTNHVSNCFKKKNKPVVSHITFNLEADDHKPVGTISCTCQLFKE